MKLSSRMSGSASTGWMAKSICPTSPPTPAADAESHARIRRLVPLVARGLLVLRRAVERLMAGPGNDGTDASSGTAPVTQTTADDAATRSAGGPELPA
jgi:hypothetical protein